MKLICTAVARLHRKRGQALVTFAVFLMALALFVGLGIDLGFAYLTRAALSKAVDAASLTGARNLSLGEDQARALAKAAFFANYSATGRDVAQPKPEVTFPSDADGTRVNVAATTRIATFFLRILPQWKTLGVSSSGQALRVRLVMVPVLDRSGSMHLNGGAAELPDAVSSFISNFDDTSDRVGLASFANNATLDLAITQPFKTPITDAVANWDARVIGRTFIDGGLTMAKNAFDDMPLGESENVARVVVFFTDGYANTFQDTFGCPEPRVMNLGSAHENPNPDDGLRICYFTPPESATGYYCYFNTNYVFGAGPPGTCCPTNSTFRSITGDSMNINWYNIWAEGRLRALETARKMRTDSARPVTIYSIGLGSGIDKEFLKEIANDPAFSGYKKDQPTGAAVFAPTAADLKTVFDTIASRILLRLTR